MCEIISTIFVGINYTSILIVFYIIYYLPSINRYLESRDYVKANDVYLRMAIGNAPWPMGVTMV